VESYDDDLRFAHVLADAADDITTKRFRALDLRVETKPDLTPVSDADRAAEDSLRNILRRSRPRDAVIGEETGQTGRGPRRWVIDPIDGTKNYVRGVQVWATLIGLMDGDEVVVGVVSAPALGRRWWAGVGGGAWTGRSLAKASRCQVSAITKLSDASFSYSGIGGWAEKGRLDGFLSLSQSVWRTRGFGDFWSHMLVAEGAVDASAEPEVSLWDLAALQVIVQEAGGKFTSLEGIATPEGGSVVCTNGHLHDEVLAHLSGEFRPSLRRHMLPPARYPEKEGASQPTPVRYPSATWPYTADIPDHNHYAGHAARTGTPGGEFPLRSPGTRPAGFPGRPGARRLARHIPPSNRARRHLTSTAVVTRRRYRSVASVKPCRTPLRMMCAWSNWRAIIVM
jgi:histidinol-phosphatase